MYVCMYVYTKCSPVMHDALGIIEGPVQVLPLVSLEHVVLYPLTIPIVWGATQRLDHLMKRSET